MKIIPFHENFGELYSDIYPVGENIKAWKHYISLIIPHLQEIIGDKPVNIWCSGSSGAILSAFLCSQMENDIVVCHVKKDGESSHHGNSFYKIKGHKAINIILDDFMRSGATVNRIWEQAKRYCDKIDVLIIGNCFNEKEWAANFIPKILIIEKCSIHEDWKKLK